MAILSNGPPLTMFVPKKDNQGTYVDDISQASLDKRGLDTEGETSVLFLLRLLTNHLYTL